MQLSYALVLVTVQITSGPIPETKSYASIELNEFCQDYKASGIVPWNLSEGNKIISIDCMTDRNMRKAR